MTMITETNLSGGLTGKLGSALAAVLSWISLVGESMSRRDEILRLHAMSDAELARFGLQREDIVAHVFRDRMGL